MKLLTITLLFVAAVLSTTAAPTTEPKVKTTVSNVAAKDDAAKVASGKPATVAAGDADHKAATPVAATADKNATAAPAKHCSRLVSAMANSGITQNCTVHDNCMGACCTTELLAHKIVYNFTVLPCAKPSVHLDFSITDIKDAQYKGDFTKSDSVTIPKGNMSYPGFFETESSLDIVLEKVVEITHFRLDFGVHYRVLKNDPLKALFSHTLVPMLTLEYSKELCVKPTDDSSELIFGVIPKSYVKDRTTLALIGTSVGLAVVLIIAVIYFIVTKKRGDGFYRTYISTDENRHLTKGNDGFEPLDDSDID